jgi:ribose transport system permease protein
MATAQTSLFKRTKNLYMQSSELGVLMVFIVLAILTSILNPRFLQPTSLINLLRSISLSLIPCLGLTFVLGIGSIDLSVGSMVALSGVICGMCIKLFGFPVVPSIIIALVGSCVGGLMIGWVIVQFNVHPMIATLGFQQVFRGLVNVLTRGVPYNGLTNMQFIGKGRIFGLPFIFYLCVVFFIVFYFLLKHTVFGRSVVAVGGNRETARLAGIETKKYIYLVHVLCALCAGIGGILTTARLESAQVSVGLGLELNALAGVIMGGTSFEGGTPTLFGTVIGVTLMEFLTIMLTMIKLDVYWQKVVLGVIIVFAVATDTYKRSRLASGRG